MPMGELWRHRGLLWQFALRGAEARHRGSRLGILWQVLSPLLMLALYGFTFGVLLHGRFGVIPGETSADYALGIFLGFTLYGLVADTMGSAPGAVVDNANLVKKVLFPLEVLPAAMTVSMLSPFLVSLGLFAIGFVLFGQAVTVQVLWLPLVLLPLFLLSLGLAWFVSALGVYFRDVRSAMNFLTTALFYVSGIFFSASSAGAGTKARVALEILRWNPVFVGIDLARDVTLWGRAPGLRDMLYLYGTSVVVMLVGYIVFRRLRGGFADVL